MFCSYDHFMQKKTHLYPIPQQRAEICHIRTDQIRAVTVVVEMVIRDSLSAAADGTMTVTDALNAAQADCEAQITLG